MKKQIFLGASFLAASCHAGAVCYVNAHAVAGGTGNSWSSALTSLEDALSNKTCAEIHVAAGVYTPTLFGSQSFLLASGTRLIGGYVGTGADPDLRDPWKYTTILSGDMENNDANAVTSSIDESTADIHGINSPHVLVLDGRHNPITTSTVIDGFVVTGGNSRFDPLGFQNGGGILCQGNFSGGKCSPILRNLVFSGNYAADNGGALANLGSTGESSPQISQCRFHGNSAGEGGAIFNDGTGGFASPVITDSTFDANVAGFGGAIYNLAMYQEALPFIQNTTFANNSAYIDGAVMVSNASRGGTAGAFLISVTSSANFDQGISAFANIGTGGFSEMEAINSILWDSESGTEIADIDANSEFDHSLVRDGCPLTASWCSNVFSTDPALGPLQNNGGYLPTMMPNSSSDAIDNGSDNPFDCPPADERGVARKQMLHCDIGAVERRLAETLFLKPNPTGNRGVPPRKK